MSISDIALAPETVVAGEDSSVSAVSWAAVFAGAVVAAAMALTLLALGAGIGLASVSPWSGSPSLTAFGVYSAVWLIIVQWLSAALGGYITGRLRTRWVGVRTDEVLFRDTAHGLLSWAVAVIIGVGVLASAATSIVGGSVQPTSTSATASPSTNSVQSYYTDELFRSANATQATPTETRNEAAAIFAQSAKAGRLSPADHDYLAQLIAARTGLSPSDAAKRVDDVAAQAKAAADTARKAGSAASIFAFFSLLIGAFIACVAGAIGGRERDL